ncbi:GNAT family N-acetyltransferase [Actinokineospora auranticolor]|uniref:ElaA protein n=1 Tax=Actinokineospora auranticolor TaxID=155976 RepID=A0A2S6GFF9_9PSEU|nr:GNAT family N-acetyltransferase [Actinokineospora auranticolor]PPK63947.1 ElaA protein [Actinokineospora auranticolor]
MALHRATGPDLKPADLYAILRLRAAVFVVEQDCAYQDVDGRDLDPDTVHLWWQEPDALAAYLRVLGAPGTERRIGRVCTAESARGTGLGGKLMAAALAVVGADESVLDAQTQAQGLYARFGYVAEGEEFLEDGIPHIRMRRPAS